MYGAAILLLLALVATIIDAFTILKKDYSDSFVIVITSPGRLQIHPQVMKKVNNNRESAAYFSETSVIGMYTHQSRFGTVKDYIYLPPGIIILQQNFASGNIICKINDEPLIFTPDNPDWLPVI